MEARSERPLSGVRILDLTRFLAGPYCTMLLADLGAEVIKIEPPEGDESRHQKAYRYGDETAYYISANRNKRGIVLDLKLPEGRQVFYELVAHADVVVDNYRAQTLRRLGADYERLRQITPDIICCSLIVFGDDLAGVRRTSVFFHWQRIHICAHKHSRPIAILHHTHDAVAFEFRIFVFAEVLVDLAARRAQFFRD